jgi:hypothetical protein
MNRGDQLVDEGAVHLLVEIAFLGAPGFQVGEQGARRLL